MGLLRRTPMAKWVETCYPNMKVGMDAIVDECKTDKRADRSLIARRMARLRKFVASMERLVGVARAMSRGLPLAPHWWRRWLSENGWRVLGESWERGDRVEEVGIGAWNSKVRDANLTDAKWQRCEERWGRIKVLAKRWRGGLAVRWVEAWGGTVTEKMRCARESWGEVEMGIRDEGATLAAEEEEEGEEEKKEKAAVVVERGVATAGRIRIWRICCCCRRRWTLTSFTPFWL